ncbi:MAG: FixH family protein [Flavobacteriales bacterium]|nr:FixH family protein [Flavobacteriales bacterium]
MNWGKGLAIAMALFIAFIVVLGIFMMRSTDSLIDKDYYEQGENHTQIMEMEKWGKKVITPFENNVLEVQFQEDGGVVKTIELKHIADSRNDRIINNQNGSRKFDLSGMAKGHYQAEIKGETEGHAFLKKIQLSIQ